MNDEHFNTLVIGAGQAGLAVGYYLARQERDFVILDANDRVGDSWRKRWDTLRLFTPAPTRNTSPGRFVPSGPTKRSSAWPLGLAIEAPER